jgi:hypothetical protein
VNAAAIAVGGMGASGKGGAFVAEHGGEKAVEEAGGGGVRWLCAFGPALTPPLCFCTAWMTRASTQDWFTVRFVWANLNQQLLAFPFDYGEHGEHGEYGVWGV